MENSNRVGEFAALERQARGRGASPRDVDVEAGIGSRDVSLDFAQMGTISRAWNMLTSFFNATVRGDVQLIRELKARPGTILARVGANITLPSVALYLMQRGDPAYQEIPRWAKDVAWFYVQRGTDQGEGWDGYGPGKVKHVFWFPKPFELGVLFGTVPERILEWMDSHDPTILGSAVDAVIKAFMPPLLPTVLVPPIENLANHSFFRDRPVVPRSREGLEPSEQATAFTGETARLVGRMLNVSPSKFQNLVRGYTGGLGGYATGALDVVIRAGREALDLPPLRDVPARDEDVLTRIPGVRGFVRRIPGTDAQSINQVYTAFEDAERKRRTWNVMRSEGRTAEAQRYLNGNRAAIVSVATSRDTQAQPGRLRATMLEVRRLQRLLREIEEAGGPGMAARRRQVIVQMQQVARLYTGRR